MGWSSKWEGFLPETIYPLIDQINPTQMSNEKKGTLVGWGYFAGLKSYPGI